MKVLDILKNSSFELLTGANLEEDINKFYAGDLLSWVMSHVEVGDVWLTVQTHLNVLAIAELHNLSCVIIVENAEVEQETIDKAKKENITLIHTKLSAVDVIRCFL